MTKIVLHPPFDRLWAGSDPFAEVDRLEGEEFRRVKCRRTFRFELEGRGFFAKRHRGVGWPEIFKNLFQLKLPVLGATNEFQALACLTRVGVPTMTAAAYGSRGVNPARRQSFLITEELVGMESLEDETRHWKETPVSREERKKLTVTLGRTLAAMHAAGVNHRDCYLCHFLLEKSTGRLFIIDLHRAQLRKRVPFRYRVKDVAGIYFSAMDIGLSRRDLARFLLAYAGPGARRREPRFWNAVERAARKLYIREFSRPVPEISK